MISSDIIYHYCGVDAFTAILQSRSIRLGNMLKMNDYVEHNWLLNLAISKLKSLNERESTSSAFYPMIISELEKGPVRDSFCASFSSDGDVLSQWRAYSDDGTGFAIGFNKNYFNLESSPPEMTFFQKETLAIWEVVYDRLIHANYIDKWIENYLYYSQKYAIIDKQKNANDSHQILWRKSITCKNPKFSEEKEIRIVYIPSLAEDNHLLEKDYRVREKEKTSFHILSFAEEKEEPPIGRIYLGPKNAARNGISELKEFISHCGINSQKVDIAFSEATYR